jgi:hypothetical protein
MEGTATQTVSNNKVGGQNKQVFIQLREKKTFDNMRETNTTVELKECKKSPKKKCLYLTLLPHREFQKLIGIPKEDIKKHILGNLKYSQPALYKQNSFREGSTLVRQQTMLR